MKKNKSIFLLILIITALLFVIGGCSSDSGSGSDVTTTQPSVELPSHKDGEVVIRVKPGFTAENAAEVINAGVKKTFTIGDMKYAVLTLDAGTTVQDALNKLEGNKAIDYVEPNFIYKASVVPNDPEYASRQYCHQRMDSEQAWNITTGSSSIVVAIIDTGVNGLHPEFSGRMTSGYDEVNNIALSGNENSDDYGHGTHVAGITAATGNNGIGVAGVDWNCKIMPIKVLDSSGSGSNDVIAQGIEFAVNNGADVINMSLGGKGLSKSIEDAINLANQNGVVVAVAIGNTGTGSVEYPAASQGVIAVGSSNAMDKISSFSTRGYYISVCAPGEEIISTSMDGSYVTFSGTSMAAPQVAGAASLLLAANPAWTPNQIRSQLEGTADDILGTGFNSSSGYGRINLTDALSAYQQNVYGSARVVVTSGGSNLTGADVLLKDTSGNTIATTKTDDNGVANFYFVRTGTTYVASCNNNGTTTTSGNINITADSTSNAQISF